MIKISTSILSSKDRIKSIKELNDTNTDYIHIDVMDNVFVPNYQLPPEEVNELSKHSKKPFDIHLMVENPIEYINKLKCKNIINNITIHVEINKNIDNIIEIIKNKGYKVGLAIKPKTQMSVLNKYINKVDTILIMSVEPGFGGQKFIKESVDRIKYIRNKNPNVLVEVDGGIDNDVADNIMYICDILVSGSYITESKDYQEAINNLKN